MARRDWTAARRVAQAEEGWDMELQPCSMLNLFVLGREAKTVQAKP